MRRLAYLMIPLLVLVFFWKLAFTDLILARGDTYLYFYPYWAARDSALAAGQLPLWTPNIFMGVPLLSDPQVGTFYPPNWLTISLSPPEAVRISILLHVAWALLGAFLLARVVVRLNLIPALIAGMIFAFGGYVGAHVEQINQLQGVSWLPWSLLVFHRALDAPIRGTSLRGVLRYTPLLAAILALQVFSGHTQTVFITGVGLGIYAIGIMGVGRWRAMSIWFVRNLSLLIVAAILAGVLALPQLYPALELTGLSNRGGGFNPQQVMAFSWSPLLAGRGILPSYDAQVFSEYVAYVGIVGLALGLYGSFVSDRRRWVWLALAGVGVFFAFGLYNPVYWTIAGLPGFNLFRVPARWLALFAIGIAMLAGLGVQHLLTQPIRWRWLIVSGVIIALIAAATLLADRAASEVDGRAVPGMATFIAWGAAFTLLIGIALLRPLSRRRLSFALLLLVGGELWLASFAMPYNDLVDPAAYDDGRMSVYQLQADAPTGRLLSISNGFFDPGDKAALTKRYADLGLTEPATRYVFTAAKLKEVIAPNLPMVWNIPSIDGYGGGVTPTLYYTQFSSLLLPDGMLRTVDGRLRELLAQERCRGGCLPELRWLNLMNVRSLIVDKTYDLSHEGIRYDTTFTRTGGTIQTSSDFVATALDVLYRGDSLPELSIFGGRDVIPLQVTDGGEVGGFKLAVALLDTPQTISGVQLPTSDLEIVALTLVDTRTGDFQQITIGRFWELVLSSDIKLYRSTNPSQIAFVVDQAEFVPDTWDGTEAALKRMREPTFSPAETVILSGEPPEPSAQPLAADGETLVEVLDYTPTRIEFKVNAAGGYLVVSEAYFPGWMAAVNGEAAALYRANVMFRAVAVPEGESTVVLQYAPGWLNWIFWVGGVAWLGLLLWLGFESGLNRNKNRRSNVYKSNRNQPENSLL